MNARDVAAFIEAGPTTSRGVFPEIGRVAAAYACFDAIAEGDKLAFVGAGDPYTTYGAFVHEVISVRSDRIRCVVDAEFPAQAIEFARIAPSDRAGLDDYQLSLDAYEPHDDKARGELKGVLADVPEFHSPVKNVAVQFVRWGSWRNGSLTPIGIVTLSRDGSHYSSLTFNQSDVSHWNNRETMGVPDALEQLATRAGRTEFISVPETIKGVTWDDARQRALHKFGADYYRETGESAFP